VVQLILSFARWTSITIQTSDNDQDTMDRKTIQTVLARNMASLKTLTLDMRCEVDDDVLLAATQCFRSGALRQLHLGYNTIYALTQQLSPSNIRPDVFRGLVEAAVKKWPKETDLRLFLVFGVLTRLTFNDMASVDTALSRLRLCKFFVNKDVADKVLKQQVGRFHVIVNKDLDYAELFV
jgi:hypothetical protein